MCRYGVATRDWPPRTRHHGFNISYYAMDSPLRTQHLLLLCNGLASERPGDPAPRTQHLLLCKIDHLDGPPLICIVLKDYYVRGVDARWTHLICIVLKDYYVKVNFYHVL